MIKMITSGCNKPYYNKIHLLSDIHFNKDTLEGFIMKIGIIGATPGKAGSRILKEALDRGHEVTAIVTSAAKITEENVKILEKDVFTLTSNDLQAFDVVVNDSALQQDKNTFT